MYGKRVERLWLAEGGALLALVAAWHCAPAWRWSRCAPAAQALSLLTELTSRLAEAGCGARFVKYVQTAISVQGDAWRYAPP
eukprot:5981085-Pleurochrysis_carterae.AAC.1